MTDYHLITSESVSEGHPDKIADQISDAVLDAIIKDDPNCRVACETLVKTGMVLVAGEITTHAWVDIEKLARKTVNTIGYNDPTLGFDGHACAVLTSIGQQSKDIAVGVDTAENHEQGAGDQGMMFGYASNETDVFMPAPITYAHRLMQRQAQCRHEKILPWLGPDAKAQITMRYENHKPTAIDAVVLSTQHRENISQEQITEAVMEEMIKPVLPKAWLDEHTRYYINPTGRFVVGGPLGDCGLTGRKLIVDTYGGVAHHGGGCFSGKDPSKVDRSAAYMARYIAKNLVAAGIAERCEIQLSYAIGVAEPVAIAANTFGTEKIGLDKIYQLINEHFDCRPHSIITQLDLLKPIYQSTAAFGHFGRRDIEFSWEKTDKADILRCALN